MGAFLAAAKHADADIQSSGVNPRGTAKACILVTLNGAPSHVDTWDPKDGPWNPADINLQQHPGGIVLSQKLFPNFSQLTNDLLILRSVTGWELAQTAASCSTIRPPIPAIRRLSRRARTSARWCHTNWESADRCRRFSP